MNPTFLRRAAQSAALLLILSACGGGGVDGGTGGTGVSAGTVTGFGSIFVNGVEFSTGGATFRRDDNPSSEGELKVGMRVEVRGSISNSTSGTATFVEVEEAVRGPLEAAPTGTPATGATLLILGQTVHVDETTLIDNNVCDGIEPCATLAQRLAAMDVADLFEVHGARSSDGSIGATFIERKTAPVVFSVRGKVASHNHATTTFSIGALSVNYGVVGTLIGDMPAPSGSNWNTLSVEVKGNLCAGAPVCGTLTATKVEPEGLGIADANKAELEGFVTVFASSSSFSVGDVPVVTIDGSTSFLGGDKNEIALGVKLEVEGSLAGGILTATKVKFKDSVKIESNATAGVASISALDGLPGVTVTANAFTKIVNSAATPTNLSALNGRNVRIRGRASGASSVIATEIEDKGASDPNSDVRLQGLATNASSPTFVILGITVNTSQLSEANFKGTEDQQIGSAAFYGAITPNGGLVKARGKLPAANALTGTAIKEVELED